MNSTESTPCFAIEIMCTIHQETGFSLYIVTERLRNLCGAEMIEDEQLTDGVSSDIREATKNIRRRYAMYYLTQTSGSVDFADLVERVASWETGRPPDCIDASTKKSVYNSLYQTHLPLLQKRDLISFNREKKTVSLTERTENIVIEFQSTPSLLNCCSIVMYLLFTGISFAGLSFWSVGLLSVASLLIGMLLLFGLFSFLVLGQLYAYYRSRRRSQRTMAPDYTLRLDDGMP